MRKTVTLFIMFILLLSVFSCKGKTVEISPDIASSDEQLYTQGQVHMKKDPERARLYFRQIIDSFPKSFYAQRAKLAIADSYYNKGDESNMIIAASEYREFIALYPYSPSASYAQHQIAMSYFKKTLRAGRDQSKTQQALLEFKKVVTNYPMSNEAKEARENIKACENKLADHVLGIGKHYYKVKAYQASINRLTDILNNYLNYQKMDQVYYFIGDSHFRGKQTEESLPFFTKLITDFPQSKFATKAQKKLEEINRDKNRKK
ncbi:outer membrane protein assembly factor BamD [Acidobacteriota bacterium]